MTASSPCGSRPTPCHVRMHVWLLVGRYPHCPPSWLPATPASPGAANAFAPFQGTLRCSLGAAAWPACLRVPAAETRCRGSGRLQAWAPTSVAAAAGYASSAWTASSHTHPLALTPCRRHSCATSTARPRVTDATCLPPSPACDAPPRSRRPR
eukprot:356902-Chlamydomonas_euryale.AAC.11